MGLVCVCLCLCLCVDLPFETRLSMAMAMALASVLFLVSGFFLSGWSEMWWPWSLVHWFIGSLVHLFIIVSARIVSVCLVLTGSWFLVPGVLLRRRRVCCIAYLLSLCMPSDLLVFVLFRGFLISIAYLHIST